MAKTNFMLSEESEKIISRLGHLANDVSKSKRTRPLKEDIVNKLIGIAKDAYDNLDDESFLNVTGIQK